MIIYGTRYVGRANLRKHLDVCRKCGRTAELSDYQARLWFTLYFIPVIPLGRKQIFDHCPLCKARYDTVIGRADPMRRETSGPSAAESQAVGAVERGDLARADELFAESQEAGEIWEPAVSIGLVEAHQAVGQHAEALDIARGVVADHPQMASDRHFRELARASERVAGEKALPRVSPWSRRSVRWGAVAAAVLALVYGISFFLRTRRELHVVNGLPSAVLVSIDGGEPVRVGGGSVQALRLPEGPHRATVVDLLDARDDVSFTIPASGLFGAFVADQTHVLNPFGASALVWERQSYSSEPRENDPGSRVSYDAGRSFCTFDDVDYAFRALPESIETKSSSNVIYKTRLGAVEDVEPSAVFSHLFYNASLEPEQLLRFAEAHLRHGPEDEDLLSNYVVVAHMSERVDRCREFLATGLARRPVLVNWHRRYQDMSESAGRYEQLTAQYAQWLAADPNSSALLYLDGRLKLRSSEAMVRMEQARAADPRSPYPLLGKSFHLMAMGRFEQACEAAELAVELAPDDSDLTSALARARMAAGEYEALAKGYREYLQETPDALGTQMLLLDVLVAQGDLDGARAAQTAYVRAVREAEPDDPEQLAIHSAAYFKALTGDFAGMLRESKALQDEDDRHANSFWAYLGMRRGEKARQAAEKLPHLTWYNLLLLSVALHAEGASDAALWRDKAQAQLAQGTQEERAFAEMLARETPVDPAPAVDAPLFPNEKCLLLVALVQGGADPKLLDLAEKLNYDPSIAAGVVRRAIQHLRNAPR